ncbi:MAG TPA: glycoside hydrolase family 31 protein [Myxococcota bacterium]
MLRFVIGSATPPALAFTANDAPHFDANGAAGVALDRIGSAFLLRDGDGTVLAGRAAHAPWSLDIDVGDAEIFGFGEATDGPNRNEQRFRIMTLDTMFYAIEGASYTAVPFFLAKSAHECVGVLVCTTFPLDVAVASGVVSFRPVADMEGSPVDVIVLRGSPAEIVQDLASLAGKTFLPPAWALGFHQSRWSYKTSDVVLDIARRFRAHDLPADVVHLDIHYMDEYRVFTFSPERFPQPKQLHDELKQLGFRTMAIIDPGVSATPYPVYEAVKAGDMLLKKKDGTAYEGKVWPGATVFPDFTQARVREAWGDFHKPLVDAGVAGFWNDMNDPVFKVGEIYDPLVEDVSAKEQSHAKMRSLYASEMAKATHEGLVRLRPEVRPFVLSRSGFLGVEKHSAIWTGDNQSRWEHLRSNVNMVLNLGLSGIPLTGADVGGFGGRPGKYGAVKWRPSRELFVRWMELGALMPFFRVHCTLYAPQQEPWSFGKKALDLNRSILRRRYRLLPLLYRLAREAHETGLPIVRPLWLHHDVARGAGAYQFLLGDTLLAAPIVHKRAQSRDVWLPQGSWIDWHTGTVHAGLRTLHVDAPLGKTPLFLRAGACLFTAQPGRNAEETLRGGLALEVSAPPPGTSGSGSLFLDDGESSSGNAFVLDGTVDDLGGRLRIRFHKRVATFAPVQHDLELRVPRAFTHAIVDGARTALTTKSLAAEDRPGVTVAFTRVSLDCNEIVIE